MILQVPLCLSAAPSEDGDLEGIQGGHRVIGVLCVSAPLSSRDCPGAGAAVQGANCWVHSVQLALA